MKLFPALGIGGAFLVALASTGVCAARAENLINIPAEPVAAALQELSRQSGVNILFVPGVVQPYQAPAVIGAHSAGEAARIILSASPLEAVADGTGGLIVRPRPQPAPRPQTPRSAPSPPPVQAHVSQPVADQAPASAQQSAPVIIVTARKNGAEAAQQAPSAVTQISRDQLVNAGANTVSSLVTLTSNLQVASVRTTALTFIRGVGTTLTAPNADPSINITLNGTYVPMEMTAAVFFDLARIDVTPGPQGTLSGHNSTGGVINLITRRPGDGFAVDGFVEAGDYGRVQAQIGVNTPISDRLTLRTAVNLIRHDGYDSNGGDDQDSKAVRVTAVGKPADGTTITGIATYSQDGGIGPFNFNVPALYGPYRALDFDPKALGFFIDYRTLTSSFEIDHRFSDALLLSYVGAYDHLHQVTKTAAWSGTPLGILNAAQSNNTGSQELRLNASTGKFVTVAGLYWFDAESRYRSATDNQDVPVSTTNSIGPFRANNNGWASFAQTTYSLTPKLRLVGGLRYSQTGKTIAGESSTTTAGGPSSGVTNLPFAGRTSLGHVDWRLAVERDLFSHSLAYGGVSTGIKPGGFSALPAVIGQLPALGFKPALLTAYTAGLKNQIADGRLTANVEGFWYDYRNYQVSQRDLATNENNVYNAARARVFGVQTDLRANLTDHDGLVVGLSLQQARTLLLVTPLGVFNGYDLPFAPDAAMYAAYKHIFALSRGDQIEFGVNGEWTSSRWGTYSHAAGTFVPATHSLDATITYRVAGGRCAVSLWGRNLTNSIVPTQVTTAPAPAGPGQEFLAPPRTYGMRFSFDY